MSVLGVLNDNYTSECPLHRGSTFKSGLLLCFIVYFPLIGTVIYIMALGYFEKTYIHFLSTILLTLNNGHFHKGFCPKPSFWSGHVRTCLSLTLMYISSMLTTAVAAASFRAVTKICQNDGLWSCLCLNLQQKTRLNSCPSLNRTTNPLKEEKI